MMKLRLFQRLVLISGVVQEMQKSKVDPCGVCCEKVMVNSL